jgi:thiol-disulfide isomerase/thioredoxin
MKKTLLAGFLLFGLTANSQLPNGSIAPDFTLTDINGVSHNLYTYLNAGKTVFIDVSATWCGPCYSYHNTNAIENLWVNHGPTGGTNVSTSTTNDVIVLFIEGDGATGTNALHGIGGVDGSTQGNWVTGVSHPIIDPPTSQINAFNTAYAIAYFPTVYKICPNRVVTEVGTVNATSLYTSVASCTPASGVNNPGLLNYTGVTTSCSTIPVTVNMQNMGSSPLTAATLAVKQGSTVLSTFNWTGNLGTFEIANVNVGTVTPIGTQVFTIEITSPDDVLSNNTITQTLSSATSALTSQITVQVNTDQYGSETTWTLKNSSNVTVVAGGPYTDATVSGTTAQTPITYTAPAAGDCYTFKINDSYGDGMNSGYGVGTYTIKDALGNTLVSGGNFASTESKKFKSGSGGPFLETIEIAKTLFNIYPNPATDEIHISFEALNADYVISIVDLAGRTILSNNFTKLAGNQDISIPVNTLSAGNYIVKITTSELTINQKVSIR